MNKKKKKVVIVSLLLLIVMLFSFGCSQMMEGIGLPKLPGEETEQGKAGSPDGLIKVLIGFKDKEM